MIRAVLFDLDGTLFDRDSAVRSLSETQYRAFEEDLTGVPHEAFVSRLLELDAHGGGDKEVAYKCLVRDFNLPEALAPKLMADFWGRYHRFCRPFPDVVDTLKELRGRGKALGLVTNGRHVIQSGTIDALGIRPLLDAILISEVEGVRKPDPAIFERAATRLGLAAFACCHVGDHPEADIAGARAAGMNAVWRRVPYWNQPLDAIPTINSLSEILEHT